ncbi:Dabb family protein [Naasia lichenicola]|uniref:Dabb family protein n=1 Tax=Naasia lichenicola TaxID=2565933 RepID=A0A4S4FPH1_9MICO|nr:Dabb family protein [Naasia lichenicola]THG31702.1 Dabb family protein [Naasia lichenicola]
MIRHTVCFTLAHPAGSDAEAAFLADGRSILAAIPGVIDFTVSRQVGKSPLQFQFAMDFESQADYDAYDSAPAHQDFVQTRWLVEVADFTEFDFVPYAS